MIFEGHESNLPFIIIFSNILITITNSHNNNIKSISPTLHIIQQSRTYHSPTYLFTNQITLHYITSSHLHPRKIIKYKFNILFHFLIFISHSSHTISSLHPLLPSPYRTHKLLYTSLHTYTCISSPHHIHHESLLKSNQLSFLSPRSTDNLPSPTPSHLTSSPCIFISPSPIHSPPVPLKPPFQSNSQRKETQTMNQPVKRKGKKKNGRKQR